MNLALFDLDNTLLATDSDHAWGEFLISQGAVDAESHRAANEKFYADYRAGNLDIQAFLKFTLAPLTQYPNEQLETWRRTFVQEVIAPQIAPGASALLDRHRVNGDELLIITATNEFVTRPIAEMLGVENLLATRVGLRDGHYTGESPGTPCFQDGKIERLNDWLKDRHEYSYRYFYSDSQNDLPLLREVDEPVAVDPDETLAREAAEKGWRIMTLRNGPQPEILSI